MPLPLLSWIVAVAVFRGERNSTPSHATFNFRSTNVSPSGKALKSLTQSMVFIGVDAAADWPSRLRRRRPGVRDQCPFLLASHPTYSFTIEGLRRMQPDKPIPFKRAVELGKRGRPKKGEEKVGVTNISKRA
jgi:hypothetical protein